MKYPVSGAALLLLATTQVGAQVDCSAYTHAIGAEPPGYALQCQGRTGSTTGSLSHFLAGTKDLDPVAAYAVQLTTVGDAEPTGLYRFGFPDFASAQHIEDSAELVPGMYGLDFDPSGSRLYAVISSDVSRTLNIVDPNEPAVTPIAGLAGLVIGMDEPTGLAIHPRTGDAWLTTNRRQTNNPPLSTSWLWRLDLATGIASYVGLLVPEDPDTVIVDIAMNCEGQLYAHNITDDSLYHINTNDLTTTRIGTHGLPANFAQGMDFDNRDGRLYAWIYTGAGDNQFGTFDLETAAFDSLSQNSPRGQWLGAIPTRCPAVALPDPNVISGAWHDPQVRGQGFATRYYPESQTLFMPWFTHLPAVDDDDDDDDNGEETPSASTALRWFALQGQWLPGDSQATLPIVQVTGGVFDDATAVETIEVGEAQLSFLSCDFGLVDYRFDAGEYEGLTGTVSVRRSLPAGSDCTQPDGSVRPGIREYDSLLTGTWYDPNAAGQGLEINYAPRQEFDDDDEPDIPGFMFATWFTFDPLPEDDTDVDTGATGQHWFTIEGVQAPREDDPEDSVRSIIYMTIGGTFNEGNALQPRAMGTVLMTTTACDRLNLAYAFSDAETTEDFQGLEGEIELHRLGACPAGTD